jgi:3-phenylpropionate/trans-cinnamate dioxygenase ferredoxin subunit
MSDVEMEWIEVCDVEDIEEEDVIRFDYGDQTFAIYRTEKGDYFASDGMCTHEIFIFQTA